MRTGRSLLGPARKELPRRSQPNRNRLLLDNCRLFAGVFTNVHIDASEMVKRPDTSFLAVGRLPPEPLFDDSWVGHRR